MTDDDQHTGTSSENSGDVNKCMVTACTEGMIITQPGHGQMEKLAFSAMTVVLAMQGRVRVTMASRWSLYENKIFITNKWSNIEWYINPHSSRT